MCGPCRGCRGRACSAPPRVSAARSRIGGLRPPGSSKLGPYISGDIALHFHGRLGLRNRPYFPGLCRGLSSRHPGSIEMTKRVAFVTIGQTPRSDLVPEILARIGVPIEAVEFGALDGMSAAEIAAAAP